MPNMAGLRSQPVGSDTRRPRRPGARHCIVDDNSPVSDDSEAEGPPMDRVQPKKRRSFTQLDALPSQGSVTQNAGVQEKHRLRMARAKLEESMEGYDPNEPPPRFASGFLSGSPTCSPPMPSPATEALLDRRYQSSTIHKPSLTLRPPSPRVPSLGGKSTTAKKVRRPASPTYMRPTTSSLARVGRGITTGCRGDAGTGAKWRLPRIPPLPSTNSKDVRGLVDRGLNEDRKCDRQKSIPDGSRKQSKKCLPRVDERKAAADVALYSLPPITLALGGGSDAKYLPKGIRVTQGGESGSTRPRSRVRFAEITPPLGASGQPASRRNPRPQVLRSMEPAEISERRRIWGNIMEVGPGDGLAMNRPYFGASREYIPEAIVTWDE